VRVDISPRSVVWPAAQRLHVIPPRSHAMNATGKILTELVVIGAVCCVGGGILLLSVALGAVLLPRAVRYPDQVVQALYQDPSVRPLMIREGVAALLVGVTALVAGIAVFSRAKAAGLAVRAALALAALLIVADVVVQGWLVVPALRKLAPTVKPPEAVMYDPRLRPWLPVGVGLALLAILVVIARLLRRPHVRAAICGSRRRGGIGARARATPGHPPRDIDTERHDRHARTARARTRCSPALTGAPARRAPALGRPVTSRAAACRPCRFPKGVRGPRRTPCISGTRWRAREVRLAAVRFARRRTMGLNSAGRVFRTPTRSRRAAPCAA
jgi:hypothetical protein